MENLKKREKKLTKEIEKLKHTFMCVWIFCVYALCILILRLKNNSFKTMCTSNCPKEKS